MDLLEEEPNLQGGVVDKLIEENMLESAKFYLNKYTLGIRIKRESTNKFHKEWPSEQVALKFTLSPLIGEKGRHFEFSPRSSSTLFNSSD